MTAMIAAILLAAVVLSPAAAKHRLPQNSCRAYGVAIGKGATVQQAMANMMGKPFRLEENCKDGFVCPLSTGMKCGIKFKGCIKIFRRHVCTKGCLTPTPVVCKPTGGVGDPHLVGFDGWQFDFHGRAGAHFVLFGRQGGDTLVCGMRSYERKVFKLAFGREVDGTLFNEFGLQVGGSGERVRVFMARSDASDTAWVLRADVNGCAVRDEAAASGVAVKFLNHKKVQIDTREHWYTFVLVHGEDEVEGHLNVEVGLQEQPGVSDRFVGVLGTTLNRRLGHNVYDAMQPSAKDAQREEAMASQFEVNRLFPIAKPSIDLTGIVARFVVTERGHLSHAVSAGSVSHEQ